jgi:hypothetical protein
MSMPGVFFKLLTTTRRHKGFNANNLLVYYLCLIAAIKVPSTYYF